jgi:autoinducer 2 (AI-2) kinase
MKQGAYLINTARAALVDQTALVSALKNGPLSGAAIDVFSIEPPGSDHPLLQLANVIATPHIGGNTFEVSSHQGAIVAADLAKLLRGERPNNLANPETFEHFSWTAPRPVPSPVVLERLRQNSRPSVTDLPVDSGKPLSGPKEAPVLQAEPPRAAKKEGLLSGLRDVFFGHRPGGLETPGMPGAEPRNAAYRNPGGSSASNAVRAQMEQLLGIFAQQINRDEKIRSFAEGRQVTVRYDLNDMNLSFYMTFDNGAVRCATGDPPEKPQVTLKMKGDILDKLFTGRENGPKAAMISPATPSG